MALAPISIKVEEKVKDRIDELVEAGLYRHVSDFMHRAIAAEIKRAELGGDAHTRDVFIELLRIDPEVRTVLFEMLKESRDEMG